MAEKIIRPGQEHRLNKTPHFSSRLDANIESKCLKPIVFELEDGRRVKVFPLNSRTRVESRFYSKLLVDEFKEKGEKYFKPVKENYIRAELIIALNREHLLHPNRF